jgi:hypothetical protein
MKYGARRYRGRCGTTATFQSGGKPGRCHPDLTSHEASGWGFTRGSSHKLRCAYQSNPPVEKPEWLVTSGSYRNKEPDYEGK